LLASFKSDSSGMPDTREIRAKELLDSPSKDYKWFEVSFKMTNLARRYRNRYYGIYKNSFSKPRRASDEVARISLNGIDRSRR
jgi:hypothetical protein